MRQAVKFFGERWGNLDEMGMRYVNGIVDMFLKDCLEKGYKVVP